jgi:DNA-binding NarL/FixJ family response regulator
MIRTLVVEENADFRQTLIGLLMARFPTMVFEEADDGIEALQKLEDFRPEIVFTEIKLLGQSGLELVRQVREASPEITVIILTSYDLPEYRQAARQNGAHHFLSKGSSSPRDILELTQSVILDQGDGTARYDREAECKPSS